MPALQAQLAQIAGVAEADALPFVEQFGPRWLALAVQDIDARASHDAAAIARVAADRKQLEADTLAAAEALGLQVGGDAGARVIAAFQQAFGGK